MFYVIEMQTNGTQAANIVSTYESRNEAMSKYHTVLAAAAISPVEVHACVVMDEEGRYEARDCYIHRAEPEEAAAGE